MRSVADGFRQVTRANAALLTPEERVEQAFRLGDDDLRAYAASKGITLDAARIEVARRRSAGRRPSPSADAARR